MTTRGIVDTGNGVLGFHRLAIMDLTSGGMQPFELDGSYVVCNGELYDFPKDRAILAKKGYRFTSDSDCEILLPMYREYGTDMFQKLDAEIACVIYDGTTGDYIAARDPIGIRQLYDGYDDKGGIVFAIANELKLPVKYVGVGEGMDDLIPFDAETFVTALFKR